MSASQEAVLRAAHLTYAEVGWTSATLPSGYRTLTRHQELAPEAFDAAVADLRSWRIHERAGLQVTGSGDVAEGAVVVLRLGWGPVGIRAPCRVIYTVDEPHRQGFAYGTLPGHPESGEEVFLIERCTNGNVTFTIRAFSRPASALARLAGPIGHWVQRRITDRYLRSAQT